ncbi:hypothetical protein AB4Z40_08585 [Bosea sp. 2YAB26]|uniref:hypothetical protein n=1 Tax=Bosea sp. 2YAB26 TaxID=3237478 RepID=UPI003F8E88A2
MARALPARFPPHGAWPEMMRADLAAAFFDMKDTKHLAEAVTRGEIPPPCGTIGKGRQKEPIWTRGYCLAFIGSRYDGGATGRVETEDYADLV